MDTWTAGNDAISLSRVLRLTADRDMGMKAPSDIGQWSLEQNIIERPS